jgi:hypothetical protein
LTTIVSETGALCCTLVQSGPNRRNLWPITPLGGTKYINAVRYLNMRTAITVCLFQDSFLPTWDILPLLLTYSLFRPIVVYSNPLRTDVRDRCGICHWITHIDTGKTRYTLALSLPLLLRRSVQKVLSIVAYASEYNCQMLRPILGLDHVIKRANLYLDTLLSPSFLQGRRSQSQHRSHTLYVYFVASQLFHFHHVITWDAGYPATQIMRQ